MGRWPKYVFMCVGEGTLCELLYKLSQMIEVWGE